MKYELLIVFGIAVVLIVVTCGLLKDFRRAFLVLEGYVGLLYHKGKFQEVLAAGRHVRWGRHYNVEGQDLRKTFMVVAGQEVLTADNIGLKLSLVLGYEVSDPVKAAHETQNWQSDLYTLGQLALRSIVNGVAAETLLNSRLDIGAQLVARVQPEAAKLGVTVHTVEVKDVMLPGELKRAFAEVLKAKQEGQAALERARGETAALRNLANAARLMESNPALMNLRLMQSVSAAQGAGSTLVVGVPGGFVPLKNGRPRSGTETETSSET